MSQLLDIFTPTLAEPLVAAEVDEKFNRSMGSITLSTKPNDMIKWSK